MTFDDVMIQQAEDWFRPTRPARRRQHVAAYDRGEILCVDLDLDLPGSIYEVPDKMWGIEAPGREWHPGICVYSSAKANQALLIKGTSQTLVGDLSRYFVLDPTSGNGLKLSTAFNLTEIRTFPRSKVALLHLGRLLGRLDENELIDLQEQLMYLEVKTAI